MKKSRVFAALVLLAVLIALLVSRCSSPSDGPTPSADLSLIGSTCDKPGEIAEADGASFVCVARRPNAETSQETAIYYAVATEKAWRCERPGETRVRDGIFSVCAGGKDAKKRKWVLTVPLPVAVAAFVDEGASTAPGALEQVGVSIPEQIAQLPGMQEFAVDQPTTTVSATTTPGAIAPDTTAPVTTGSETTAPGTTVPGTTSPETSTPSSEVSTAGSGPGSSSTSAVKSTTTSVEQTTTSASDTTSTTAEPDTTVASNNATTSTASTISESTTTAAPETTVGVPLTTSAPTSTVAPAKARTCAEGGKCVDGDLGPGGGTVIIVRDAADNPLVIIEVAPVTWYLPGSKSNDYAESLTYGSKTDWRLPTAQELVAVRAKRNLFVCPQAKRCALGFANAPYWADGEVGLQTLNFANDGNPEDATPTTSHYLRPVRVIQGAVG